MIFTLSTNEVAAAACEYLVRKNPNLLGKEAEVELHATEEKIEVMVKVKL